MIFGCLNVGKLLLLNKVVGEECVVVNDFVGIICDLVDEVVEFGGKMWCLVDMVGICCCVYMV